MTQRGNCCQQALESCTVRLNTWKPFNQQKLISKSIEKTTEHDDPMGMDVEFQECIKKQKLTQKMQQLSLLDDEWKKINRVLPPVEHERSRSLYRKPGVLAFTHHTSSNHMPRKRRRGSCSGSGRSSVSRNRNRGVCGSDPAYASRGCGGGGASVNYATCSDFPIAIATDSSGELFNYGDSNWCSEMNNGSCCNISLNGFKREGKELGSDLLASLQGLDVQSIDSGYGSEPGYRGDEELGYDDEDDNDESECRTPFWGDSVVDWDATILQNAFLAKCGISGERLLDLQDKMQLVGKRNNLSEQRPHHRFRRRRHDWRLDSHGSRHSLIFHNN